MSRLIALAVVATLLAVASPAAASITFVRSWGGPAAGTGPGQFSSPQGIAVDPASGDVWVADSNNSRVQHFDASGNFVNQWGSFGSANGQFSGPHGIAIGPDGLVYVADTGNGRIQRFDQAGNFQATWNGDGTTPGRLSLPDSVAVGGGNAVYVSDGNNDRIQVFDTNGAPLFKYGSTGSGDGQLSSPFQVTADARDNLFIADTSNHRIVKLDNGGNFAANFAPPDTFGNPVGVAVDASGNIFAADSSKSRIVEFDATGKFLTSVGSSGTGNGELGAPFGVAVRGSNLYVVENNNNRVSQFTVTPDPVLGKAMTGAVTSGTVLVRLPGTTQFIPLTTATSLPVGSIVDARKGKVRITATSGGKTFFADFFEGVFQLAQGAGKNATADIKLFGGNFRGCPKAPRASKKPKSVRHLWGSGSGPFRTVGRYASAVVRGTTWLTDDQCTATLVRVTQGTVSVRDLVKRKAVLLRAGQRYLARAKVRG